MRRLWAVAGVVVMVATGCTGGGAGEPGRVTAASSSLVRFDGCEQLLSHLKGQALEQVGPWGLGGGFGALPLAADARAESSGTTASSGSAAAPVHSTTNVQEAGVDEPDLVKTDGRVLFVVGSGAVHSVSASDNALLGSLRLDGYPTELLMSGGRLLVFGHAPPEGGPGGAEMAIYPSMGRSRIWTVDASDPRSMTVARTVDLDGGYRSARLVEGVARVVTLSSGPHIAFTHPQEPRNGADPAVGPSPEAERRARDENRRRIATSTIEEWVPRFHVDGTSRPLTSCGSMYRPAEFAGLQMATVFTLDPTTGVPDEGAAVVGSGEIVYSSPETLYLTTTRWDQPAGGPDDVVSSRRSVPLVTAVHAFDIRDSRSTRYLGSGELPGRLLNQFSLSEHGGVLRAAVTRDDDANGSSSSVLTLRLRDGVLGPEGRLDGLGPTEQIHAVRFMGELAYVVTFRRVDPLHVVDLSDPARPVLRGELHIPGYSAYLHPVGDGLLLGVGQDATDEGMATGLQASLFDVSDPTEPRRIQQWMLPGGHSEAEFDHRAFLWWEPERLAVVPAGLYDGRTVFQGAVALEVGREAIRERGRLQPPPDTAWSGVRRSVVVGETLFSVSDAGILRSDLRMLQSRGWIGFPGAPQGGHRVPMPAPLE